MKLILKSSLRYMLRHPWQFLLSILGIALGVAVVISIDIANESARQAFTISSQTIAGKATHQIIGPPGGLPQEIYRKLRIDAKIRFCAPVIEGYVTDPDYAGRTFYLLGVDPIVDGSFRPYLTTKKSLGSLSPLLSRPSTGVISIDAARQMGIREGDTISIRAGSVIRKLSVIGFIYPGDELGRQATENLLLTDIATAQELLEKPARISRIDLLIPEGSSGQTLLDRIKKILPKEAKIITTTARSQAIVQMTRAFNINLTAMSMLALLVGMFLIYNTMTFSVLQRRSLFGMLRAIGVTRRELLTLILGEALITAIIGTTAGIFLGIILGKGMVSLVTQAINDIYFVLAVTGVEISLISLFKGVFLGIFSSVAASLIPALEATTAPPRSAMSRSVVETSLRLTVQKKLITGILLILLASIILFFPVKNLILSIAALFIIVLGFALLTPACTIALTRLASPVMGRLFGILGRMSARSITSSLSRTSVAIAALMIAVSVTVGVGIMVGSLRYAVILWMENFLKADIYISPPSLVYSRTELTIDPSLVKRLCSAPGILGVTTYRGIILESPRGLTQLIAVTIDPQIYHAFRFKEGKEDLIWPAFEKGNAVIVSEPYAYRFKTTIGSSVHLLTDRGEKEFPVAGIFYDYTSDSGVVLMSRKNYEKFWDDRGVSSLAIYVKPGVNVDNLISELRKITGTGQEIVIQSNQGLRRTSLEVFDRTFTVTFVLRILAMIVAFIGVLNALMALQLERAREMGVLRANGLTPGQVWWLIILQTVLMGILAGFMALLLGIVLATILIFVINRISFGWTMEMIIDPEILLQAMLLSLSASVLAGIYPAIKMAKTSPAQALREE